MAIETVWCPVVRTHVTRVTSLEGEVISLICPEFNARDSTCRVKAGAMRGGPLSQLVEHMAEGTLARPAPRCDLR